MEEQSIEKMSLYDQLKVIYKITSIYIKGIGAIIVITTIIYIAIKFLLSTQQISNTQQNPNDLQNNSFDLGFLFLETVGQMDFWGILVGVSAFVISILIIHVTEKKNDKQFDMLKEATKNLEDATRKILVTLPDILDESLRILNKIEEPINGAAAKGKILILNFTSQFGVIHSFNKRFLNQIKDSPFEKHPKKRGQQRFYYNKVISLRKKIKELDDTLIKKAKIIEKFNLLTYKTEILEEAFIQKYFETEEQCSKENLFYYPYSKMRFTENELIFKGDYVKKNICECVQEEHSSTIDALGEELKNFVIPKNILPDYQLLLVQYVNEKKDICNEAMIIFAVNDERMTNDHKPILLRNIIAVSSQNVQMFNAFETLFNGVKDSKEN